MSLTANRYAMVTAAYETGLRRVKMLAAQEWGPGTPVALEWGGVESAGEVVRLLGLLAEVRCKTTGRKVFINVYSLKSPKILGEANGSHHHAADSSGQLSRLHDSSGG